MVAVRNYSPEDRGRLSFHKGDIIHLQSLEHPERGEGPPKPSCQNGFDGGPRGSRLMASPALEVAVCFPCIL